MSCDIEIEIERCFAMAQTLQEYPKDSVYYKDYFEILKSYFKNLINIRDVLNQNECNLLINGAFL